MRHGLAGFAVLVLLSFALPDRRTPDAGAEEARRADLVVLHGKVVTVDARDRVAEAVAIRDGKFVLVGSDAEVERLVGPDMKVVDAKGRMVSPGIVDSHLHVLYHGKQSWPGFLDIRFPAVKTREDLLRVVGEKARSLRPGEWVSANQGFHIPGDEPLTAKDLDAVAPRNPVYLRHASGQYAVVNTEALRVAKITRSTPDPYGSRIVKDPRTGEPNGILLHYPAAALVARHAPGYGERSAKELEDDILRGQEICLSAGITSAQDVIVGNRRDVEAYQRVEASGRLRMRVYILYYVGSEEDARKAVADLRPFRSERLVFGGWKLAVDGGLAAGTTLMVDESLAAAKNAYWYHAPDALVRIVRILHDTGLAVAVHVTGDKGLEETLDAFEAVQKAAPRPDPRHRLEHALFVPPAAIDRIRRLGLVVSTQPQWITWHGEGFRDLTSEGAMQTFLPLRSMLRAGIPLAFGCDVPASMTHEPKWALAGALLRRTKSGYSPLPEEALTRTEILRVHTMGGAFAAREEKEKGSIEVGKMGDLVVWSHDWRTVTAQDFAALAPVITVVGGEVVYGKP